ncbi:MAG: nicotinamidase [Chloroflexia bacterium]|nr:nicotinamidase [Chloroflexia bacterium]
MKSLIIVDMQRDFLPGGSLAVNGGYGIIPYINGIVEDFGLIVFTQDFHPANHGSFASQQGLEPFMTFDLNGIDQVAWPDHCIQGTSGVEIHPDVLGNPALKKKDFYIFKKGLDPAYDSYSGFYDANGQSTGLSEFLREKGVKENHIVGLATDYCVKFTALDSKKCGFETFVHSKGVTAIDPETDAFHKMAEFGIEII